MTRWRVLAARLGEWLGRRRVEDDLDEELRSHVDLLTDEHVRRGKDRDEARRAALREFGGLEQVREAVRDRRGFRLLDALMQDLRYAVRLLVKAPGFTVTAVLTLGLGVGANAAIFSLVDAVMLRPLPYADPDRLVAVWELGPSSPSGGAGSGATTRIAVAPANLADYRRARSVAGIAGYVPTVRSFSGAGTPERLGGEEVTPEYFAVLGVAPLHGRPFQSEDAESGRHRVVLVSHGFWRDRLGGDSNVLGEKLRLDGETYELVGVMPPGVQGVSQLPGSLAVDFWVPAVFPADVLNNRRDHEVGVVARLVPGASPDMIRDELRGIAAGFGASGGDGLSVDVAILRDDVAAETRPLLLMLLAAVGLVLVLACVNVSSLLIVRSIARRREIAVRLALGATRARVGRELVTQALVLAGCGAAVGLVCAALIKDWLVALAPPTVPRLDAVAIDGRVLLFTAGVSALAALVFGLLPALQLGRAGPGDALGTTERVVSGTWATRARTGLVVAEVAFSTLLLVGAGLMIRSLVTLNRVPLGFDTSNVLTANLRLSDSRYPDAAARLRFFEAVAERAAQLPGAEVVSFANRLPMRGGWTSGLLIEPPAGPRPAESDDSAGFQAVSPGYFDTLKLRLVRGRLLQPTDRDGMPAVAVVSEEFGRRFFGGGDPVGRRFRRFAKAPSVEIVGVVGDIRRGGRMANIEPEVYLPAAQTSLYPLRLEQLAVRFRGDAMARAGELRAAVWSIDRDQPVAAVQTLEQVLALRQGERHFQTFLFTIFAALALVLAVVGIYGVAAYAVGQRTAEIALRMALGATAGVIQRWVLGHWLKLIALGTAAGVAAALLLGRFVRSLLFEISPADAIAFAGAAAVLALAALAACLVAARAATRVDATSVLK